MPWDPKDGAPPVPDDQGNTPHCTRYAISKGVMQWLHNRGRKGDQDKIVQVLIAHFSGKIGKPINSYDFHNECVTIEVDGKQDMKVKMAVETVKHCAGPFASTEKYQKFETDNDGCLIQS